MAIVINGSGTVTGLAVGGLPDGTVDTDTLANTTVTAAKVAADVATQAEIDAKLPIASPTSTGILTVNGGAVANAARFNSTGAECSIQTINDSRTWSWGVRDIGSVANACFIHDNGASADRFVINTAGVVSIPQGIELGSGIDATASNVLDDYEEGTWTGTFAVSSGSVVTNNSNNTGRYTRIGRSVHVQGVMVTASHSSPSGTLTLSGLPFACGSDTDLSEEVYFYIGVNNIANNNGATNQPLMGYLGAGSQTITIYTSDGNNLAGAGNRVNNNGYFGFSFTYSA